jgi:hypothetical protein
MKITLRFFDVDVDTFKGLVTVFMERIPGKIEHAKLKRYFSEINHPRELPTNGSSWELWVKEREHILKKGGLGALHDSPEAIANFVLYKFFSAIKEKHVAVDPAEPSEGDWSLCLQVPMKDQCITLEFVMNK